MHRQQRARELSPILTRGRGGHIVSEARARTGSLTRCHASVSTQVSLGVTGHLGNLLHWPSYEGAVKRGGLFTPTAPESLSSVSKELHPSYSLQGGNQAASGFTATSIQLTFPGACSRVLLQSRAGSRGQREGAGEQRVGAGLGREGQEDTGLTVSANQKKLCVCVCVCVCVCREGDREREREGERDNTSLPSPTTDTHTCTRMHASASHARISTCTKIYSCVHPHRHTYACMHAPPHTRIHTLVCPCTDTDADPSHCPSPRNVSHPDSQFVSVTLR